MDLAELERVDFSPPTSEEMEADVPGCRPIVDFPTNGVLSSFLSGDPDSMAVRVRYFLRETDGVLLARAWFGPAAKGPPAHAHGGSIASLLDEAMGCCAWNSGHPVLAARLTVSFRASLPLGRIYMAEAWIESATGRKLSMMAKLVDAKGVVYAEGEGLFVELSGEQRTQMMAYRELMAREGL
jgi:acyl-coenzyme A thioesterase PaaI-like protein